MITVPALLDQLERQVAARRIWISGSWPIEAGGEDALRVHQICEDIGRLIASSDRDLVSGAGLLVGTATISGFFDALRIEGAWDLDRRLIVRPFPQPIGDKKPNKKQWTGLREELARLSGIVIFVGGAKYKNGKVVLADGVAEEFELAKQRGAFLLPIGATGGAAKQISETLIGSEIPYKGPRRQRPNDDVLKELADNRTEASRILELIAEVLKELPSEAQ